MKIGVEFTSIEEMLGFAKSIVSLEGLEVTETAETIQEKVNSENVPRPEPARQPQPAPQPEPVPAPQQSVQPAAQAVQTTSTAYTLDDLARAAMTLMDAGKQLQLQQLLAQHGVEALPQLPLEQYGTFATELRGLGAQI
ncbi:hypothetical protein [Robinsoniella sp. KNHs210]|uniref:hypothetical protein n=1 Tax=Robinsoniella sp. KNHs210 TaxID=1469950 RepID=UPI00048798BB|nr:hypothetical protein [Robinsoniella sp. KNHs210]